MSNSKTKEKAKRRRCRDELLRILREEARNARRYRRLLCVGLKPHLTTAKIASILSLDVQTVRNIYCKYRNCGGAKALIGSDGRGGRHRENMSRDDELAMLNKSCLPGTRNIRDRILIETLKSNYKKAVNSRTAPLNSTIYRLLKRHGCLRVSAGLFKLPKSKLVQGLQHS